MARWLRTLVLAVDPGSVPSTHTVAHNSCGSTPRDLTPSLGFPEPGKHAAHTHACRLSWSGMRSQRLLYGPQLVELFGKDQELWSRCAFVRGDISLVLGSEISKAHARPNLTLFLPAAFLSDVASQLLLGQDAWQPATQLLTMMITDQPSETVDKSLIKCFIL